MNGAHRCRPLAYSGRDAFDRAGAHVGNGKQSWIAGLERERPAPSTAISGNVTGDNGAQGHRFRDWFGFKNLVDELVSV